MEIRVAPYRTSSESGFAVQKGKTVNGRWKTRNVMAGLRSEKLFCSEILGAEEAKKQANEYAGQWRKKIPQIIQNKL